ncbi:MAG: hypothetical protein HYX55_07420 [Chloroflexi bacterium]|nr:hypothetical protein [Chloroflexota bacterium]
MRSGGHLSRLTRLAGLVLAIVAFVVMPGAAPASIGPGDAAIRELIDAPTQGGGSGGTLGDPLVGLILIAGLVVAVVVLLAAAYVLFRTRSPKVIPPSEGWWTCTKCGASNMDGSARCHACSTWRAATPKATPSS